MKMPKIDTRTLRASFIIAGMLSFAITILVITNHTSDIFSSYKLDLIYYLSMFSICLIGVIPLGTIVYILFCFSIILRIRLQFIYLHARSVNKGQIRTLHILRHI